MRCWNCGRKLSSLTSKERKLCKECFNSRKEEPQKAFFHIDPERIKLWEMKEVKKG